MDFYAEEIGDVYRKLNTSEQGLSQEEALKRQQTYGKNQLVQPEKESLLRRFLNQLNDPMVIILLVAAAISGVLGIIHGEGMADVVIILIVVVINSVLGVYQENKAEEAIEALKKMTAATSKVERDGKRMILESAEIVPGDIIYLEAGDAVPADGRIIESASLKIEEASLTGESEPVSKFIDILHLKDTSEAIPLGDRKNMCYMGSTVVYGHGKAVVTNTGMTTEMGKIAGALSEAEDEQTPLQRKLAELSVILTKLVIGVCVFIFIFALIRNGNFSGPVILDTFMVAVSLAVAAIPEGLVAVVTIVLSIGVTNMSKRNAVIRKLTAVETLGSAQVICSDKTGTLTQNRMTVVETWGDDEPLLIKAMALSNDAVVDSIEGDPVTGKINVLGEPTEAALVVYAERKGQPHEAMKSAYLRIGEAPFDSMRKMMSTVHNNEGKIIQFTKGAPDEVLKKCVSIYRNGKEVPLTDEIRDEVNAANAAMASQALRVLAGACKFLDSEPSDYSAESLEHDLVFLGLMGMIDPIRPEVIPAIEECRVAGITPVMITGDHKDTAVAIANQLGLLTEDTLAITGSQLDKIDDDELQRDIAKYRVYARVQPEHKVRIVKAWRANDKVTAMTGDGVNDAPSIKNADIGVGMGITGTDVTKNVADMVLADDNFATIVSAVEEGRRIYDNILKVIQFLLSSNLSEVISIFVATLLGFQILKPVHILWINLITDSIPALALGVEKAEGDLMLRKPRDPKAGVFSDGMGFNIAYQGIMVSILTVASYFIGHYLESGVWEIAQSPDGITMAFLTMSMAEIFHSLNMRSQHNSIFTMKSSNIYLFFAMILALVLTTVVIEVPFIANLFDFEVISFKEYAVAMGLAVSVIPIVELVKWIQRRSSSSKYNQ
ncbi:MAG: calcium-translocating P-type ATPase, PMCA-type [Chloroflexi bacterium]|nr:calcium-translocating P-type ATPase, PMCA-type [Chloroflexota bacterium]